MDFAKRYAKLNKAQQQAVDAIEGPVMVIAGPGTGKTELLSMRTANILQKTDTLAENILCLTFTDSGAAAMRDRLAEIIGKESYKVAVHTFHSFGAEVINQNEQYFYQGAHFHAADQLSSYKIIQSIFEQLDYNNPIAKKMNGEYTYLPDSLTAISELKESGLVGDELLNILDENSAVIEKTEQLLSPIFAKRIDKTTADQVAKQIETIKQSGRDMTIPTIIPLSKVLADSITNAVDEAVGSNSTKPITAWRNKWFTKDDKGSFVLKSRNRQIKLRALSYVYEQYLSHMQQAELYDFDDMILRVVHAMEVYDDLRFNLQERYQYIMVDEFQDTNMAQMRILHNLTNNDIQGDTPNIMVVGDDDQAIYSFQGADISNILNFRSNYPKSKIITLTNNYRSTSNILSNSRNVILQGHERLENYIPELNKELSANNNSPNINVNLYEAETITDERNFIISSIKSLIDSGQKPGDIAVFTRRHSEINNLLPYFFKAGIAVNYERRDNALDLAPIKLIEQIARLLINIANNNYDEVNASLPEILAHKAWEINPIEIWKLSLKAYNNHTNWLDIMSTTPEFTQLHNWLINSALMTFDTPLEQMLDIIIGKSSFQYQDDESNFVSPLYNYFFSSDELQNNPNEYLTYLEALRTIRSRLKEYQPDQTPTLSTFIEFITLSRKIGSTISIIRRFTKSNNAINIMTAHKSKGLEFRIVYIMNAIDTIWGDHARSRNRLINYPENLPLAPAGETDDERLRLFYVAMTRAKNQLNISYSLSDDNGKNTLRAGFLLNDKWQPQSISSPDSTESLIESAELAWYQPLTNPTTVKMRDLLLPTLENYKLSVTHLHNFLDITRGGPSIFLLQNLLRFPQAKSSSAEYGTAIHNTLQHTQTHLVATGKKQAIEDIISDFEKNLNNQHLLKKDFDKFLQKGSDALRTFLDQKYDNFTTTGQTELNFANQYSIINDAHLTGKLDLVDINKTQKTITVTDYKTGKPANSWLGRDEYEKIKLHNYKQQLMFYKLLVESSRDYHDFNVEKSIMQFIEPTISGDIRTLESDYNSDDIDQFKKLINAVWTHIIQLNLPDITSYDKSYKGILSFERDLIDNLI
jgi:DNA helicase-2/ATP-dependent DNA helicase PcrA